MKKTIILLLVLLTGIFSNSCNKSSDESFVLEDIGNNPATGLLANPEYRQALLETVKEYSASINGTRDAEFLPVFFTPQAFFVLDETATKLATFSTFPDADDFLRENPDGTYSVHIVSENALCELFDYSTNSYYVGNNGEMVMNYSGPAELIAFYDWEGNLLGYIYIIDYPNDVSPATVWHGHGPVQLFGMGPEMNLIGKLTASAKWKNVKTVVRLD